MSSHLWPSCIRRTCRWWSACISFPKTNPFFFQLTNYSGNLNFFNDESQSASESFDNSLSTDSTVQRTVQPSHPLKYFYAVTDLCVPFR